MKVPDWRRLVLVEGVIPEPTQEEGRIVLWLPGQREEEFQCWERISNVARAPVTVEEGWCTTPAVSIRARQRFEGFFGKLQRRFRRETGEQTWLLPNGDSAQQWGERQTDLLLLWSKDETAVLDAAGIQRRWPRNTRLQQLADNLFLIGGVALPAAGCEKGTAQLPDPVSHPVAAGELEQAPEQQRELAEQRLAAASQGGDRRREADAFTDLALVCMREGDWPRATALLEGALTIVRQLGDRAGESEVLNYLGLPALALGQPRRARELFEQALKSAQEAGDRFTEKVALERLGIAWANLRDPVRALDFFAGALSLARQAGDRQHQADLLWHQAIQLAELGRRDQAMAQGQLAVDLLSQLGKPQAGWFAEHLHKYRLGNPGDGEPGRPVGGSIIASPWSAPARPAAGHAQQARGPGWLVQALTAATALARFIASGCKKVTPEAREQRLRTCAACEQHTGLRCRVCGCFTSTKAWLRHEDCPLGRWSRLDP